MWTQVYGKYKWPRIQKAMYTSPLKGFSQGQLGLENLQNANQGVSASNIAQCTCAYSDLIVR